MQFVMKPVKAVILAALVAATTACSNGSNTRTVDTVSTASTAQARAEEIAVAGETLLSAEWFVTANSAFQMALENDPNNARALFYSKLLAPVMKLKGIAVRMRPLMSKAEREKQDAAIAENPNSEIKAFLIDGKEDLRSEKDVQALLDEVITGFDEFRTHLKATKNQTLTLNSFGDLRERRMNAVANSCRVKQVSETRFEVGNCDFSTALKINVNRADKEALQQIVAGYQIALSVANAYRMDGVVGVRRSSPSSKAKDVQQYLMNQPNWGVLRNSKYLTSILDMGRDAIAGVRWLQAHQTLACPKGQGVARQRAGRVFEDGVCVSTDSATNQAIAIAENILSGGIYQDKNVAIRPAAILERPIQDLKTQLPIEADKCGRIVKAADPTFGGWFPNGDIDQAFASTCEQGNEQ